MSFFGKICKVTSICLMAVGGVVTAGSIGMLGYGTQATYNVDGQICYIGSVNFNKNLDTGWITYNQFVDAAKLFLKAWDLIPPEEAANPELQSQKKMFEAVVIANDLMITGAVLFSISVVTLGVGVLLFVLNKKKEK